MPFCDGGTLRVDDEHSHADQFGGREGATSCVFQERCAEAWVWFLSHAVGVARSRLNFVSRGGALRRASACAQSSSSIVVSERRNGAPNVTAFRLAERAGDLGCRAMELTGVFMSGSVHLGRLETVPQGAIEMDRSMLRRISAELEKMRRAAGAERS